MSQENLEVAKLPPQYGDEQGGDAGSRPAIDAGALADPEVEWDRTRGERRDRPGPGGGPGGGPQRWLESFDDYRFEAQRFVDCRA